MGFVCLNQGVCAFTYLLSLVCLSVCVPCVRVCMCVQALHRLRDIFAFPISARRQEQK